MCTKILIFLCLTIIGNGFGLEELIERKKRAGSAQEVCEGKPVDIGFIIDSSRTIYPPDYEKAIKFLGDFINIFEIGPDNVRIAAVSFGEKVITDTAFGFDKYSDKEAALAGIKAVRFRPELGDHTNTHLALAYARKNFKGRPNIKKIAIILTDGRSDFFEKTKAEADQVKSIGVEIIAIGVGSKVSVKELNAIASSDEDVFEVISYEALRNIRKRVAYLICKDC